jgi:Serine acetyltransferase
MNQEQTNNPLIYRSETVERLCRPLTEPGPVLAGHTGRLPSVERLNHIIRLVSEVMFPDFFDDQTPSRRVFPSATAVRLDEISEELSRQIRRAIRLTPPGSRPSDPGAIAAETAEEFIRRLPDLRDILLTDVDAMYANDPAANDRSEVIFCYPAFKGMMYYRLAHALLEMNVPLLPRIITESAHSLTGIDIHPGAVIGPYFSIDHGTGVVIGETCRIGHHVSIYQGVTLGARNFVLDDSGKPINLPRHPILEDYVTVYSNATILGRITVGHHAVVGGNVWVTRDVPPHARLLQRAPLETKFDGGLGI